MLGSRGDEGRGRITGEKLEARELLDALLRSPGTLDEIGDEELVGGRSTRVHEEDLGLFAIGGLEEDSPGIEGDLVVGKTGDRTEILENHALLFPQSPGGEDEPGSPSLIQLGDEEGGIPLESSGRDFRHPLIIAGGPCAINPEPMHAFFDLFFIGEVENTITQFLDTYRKYKNI